MKLKTHLLYTAIFLICGLNVVLGQGFCDQTGGFTINRAGGCAPFTATVTNTVTGADIRTLNYYYNYQKGSNTLSGGTNATSSTYSIPGPYTILQTGSAGGRSFSQCEDIIVYQSARISAQAVSCGGGNVTLTFTNNAILQVYDEVEINWGDGSDVEKWRKGDALILEHLYSDTSVRPTINIKGIYIGNSLCEGGQVLPIIVNFEQAQLENIKISSVTMRDESILRVTYVGLGGITTYVKYKEASGTTFTTAGSRALGGDQPFDVRQVDPSKVYQVQVESEDRCGGILPSNVVNSMVIKGESSNGSIKLSWNKYDETATGFQGYDLYANGELLKSFSSVTDTEYIDTDVECGSYVSYYIIAKLTGVTSQSATVGLRVETDANSLIERARVTVAPEGILILADVPGKRYNLNIERSENGSSSYKRIMTLPNVSEYIDTDVNSNEKSYCYRFSYESCDVKYPNSEPICTILLKKDLSLLSWSPEPPFLDDLRNYTVLQAPLNGPISTETDRQQNLTFTPQFSNQSELEYRFFVRAISQDGNFESTSNMLVYRRGAGLFVPDVFTPNNDSYNNTLLAVGEQVKSFDFTIMNRWGNVVFHTSNLAEGWDGKINGAEAAVGSYVYKIVFVDDIDQKVEKRGTFMLLR
jgi:gliding motility-associated-like protein